MLNGSSAAQEMRGGQKNPISTILCHHMEVLKMGLSDETPAAVLRSACTHLLPSGVSIWLPLSACPQHQARCHGAGAGSALRGHEEGSDATLSTEGKVLVSLHSRDREALPNPERFPSAGSGGYFRAETEPWCQRGSPQLPVGCQGSDVPWVTPPPSFHTPSTAAQRRSLPFPRVFQPFLPPKTRRK